jgi:hypothetical protein
MDIDFRTYRSARFQECDKLGERPTGTVDAAHQYPVHTACSDRGQQGHFAGALFATSLHWHGAVAEYFGDCPALTDSHSLQTLDLIPNRSGAIGG